MGASDRGQERPLPAIPDEPDVSDIESEDEDISPEREADGQERSEGSDRAESRLSSARPLSRIIRISEQRRDVSPIRTTGEEVTEKARGAREDSPLENHPRQEEQRTQPEIRIPDRTEENAVAELPPIRPEEEYADESRDVPTEIPSSANGSPSLHHSEFAQPHTNGQLDGIVNSHTTPTLSAHQHHQPRTSISKSTWGNPGGGGGLHRRSSTRSTLSVAPNPHLPSSTNSRDRVRYSWQSILAHEPNRPRIHIIKLVSNTATASAGFPSGEAFGFSISPSGRRIAAYNSARLYVLQTAALPVGISQDYALRRRPLAVELTDDAATLAILADDHTVNIYSSHGSSGTGSQRLRRIRTLTLDFPTSCIALAPTGALLAAAYESGVEIFSLAPDALDTDRRAVRAPRMDRLSFSEDGGTLLGTTTRAHAAATVVVNVPVFPAAADGIPTASELKQAWCADLLHPENIRNSSHATFLRDPIQRKACTERLFAWNGSADTFGVLNVADLEYGRVDFPVVIAPPLSTCGGLGAAIHSVPAVDEAGETVAMVVNERTVRLYIVPPAALSGINGKSGGDGGEEEGNSGPVIEAHSIDHELDEGYGCPFSEVRWVYNATASSLPDANGAGGSSPASLSAMLPPAPTPVKGRLIVTSPGGVMPEASAGAGGSNLSGMDDITAAAVTADPEGGRILLFDFDPQFAGHPGQTYQLTLGRSPPQQLEEPQLDVAAEVALVRRRTVNASRSAASLAARPVMLGRAASTFGGGPGGGGAAAAAARASNRLSQRSRSPGRAVAYGEGSYSAADEAAFHYQQQPSTDPSGHPDPLNSHPTVHLNRRASLPDLMETNESAAAFEEPYAQFAPRSQVSLQRAATNAQRHRFQALEEQQQEQLGGAEDLPAANFLPLPEYTAEPNAPLPSRFRAMAGLDQPMMKGKVPTGSTGGSVEEETGGSSSAAAGPSTAAAQQGPPGANDPALSNLPRSLQRAYTNAPLGPATSVGGDWGNVSPVGPSPGRGGAISRQSESATWNSIVSPLSSTRSPGTNTSSPTGGRPPIFNPHATSTPHRASSSAGSNSTTSPTTAAALTQHQHPNFRAAAIANATAASLFPTSQPRDHVPLRAPPASAGSVAHPITAWHPPAASVSTSAIPYMPPPQYGEPSSPPPPHSAGPGSGFPRRSHSRHSSAAGRSAFASTATARRLGFFKKGKRPDPYGFAGGPAPQGRRRKKGTQNIPGLGPPSAANGRDGSFFETKSMMTWGTRGDGKCAVM